MGEAPIGFIGLGRLGSVVASILLEAGRRLVCCDRGRIQELVEKGAQVPGDGSPRAVAEAAEVVFTCLPGDAIGSAFDGPAGVVAGAGEATLVVDLSTAEIAEKQRLHGLLAERGGLLLDCPISGTPQMVAKGASAIFASGERAAYERVAGLLAEISPGAHYVGELGSGTKMKYVANLLVLAHVAAAGEAMAFAQSLGLDLVQVAELLSNSPAATSGQFQVRAPLIAAGQFEGKLVTIADARENLDQITAAASAVGAQVPLADKVKGLFDEVGEAGGDESDPARLALFLRSRAAVR
ncbi:MAG: NAD(P)-dependent oxidoreductase [Actinobacteria bacterium]|nr:NAD(P)-dependent oxidoreductase [Actinomycetota bacterium]